MSEPDLNRSAEPEIEYFSYAGTTYYTIETTLRKTRLGRTVIERCVSFGIVQPVQKLEVVQPPTEGPFYSEADLLRLRRVRRLINELGLNWAGVEVVMRLTDELEAVRAELTQRLG